MNTGDEPVLDVLVVEEDAQALDRVVRVLEGLGLTRRIDTESHGEPALRALLAGEHDLCLLGVQVKAPGGDRLLRAARSMGCRMPVILLLDEEAGKEEAGAADPDAQDALGKGGVAPGPLRRAIHHVMARARIQDQLESSRSALRRHQLEMERLMAALDQHAIVSVADAQGNITYANDKLCEISGYERGELIGQNHRMLKSDHHDPAFYRDLWARISSGLIWQGELCNRRKDGTLYWVRGTIVPFAGDDGLPYQYVSIRTDITAIKEAESRLRLLGKALEASVDGIAIADARQPDTPLIYVNPAFSRLTGYGREALLGYNCRFLQGDDREQPGLEEIRSALREGRPARALLRNYRKDGSLFWNDFSITPVLDDEGRLSHFVGVANDVTARYDTERALRLSEERLRRSQAYADIGTWDWDIKTGHLYWSERIAPLFGYSGLTETSYDKFIQAVHPEDRQRVTDAVHACVERGEKYDIEHRCLWPDGTVRWLLERGDVTRDPDGSPSHMLGVVQDITARKLAEEALRQSESNLSMAQRVAHLGSFDWNPVTDALRWSDEHYRLWGFEPGALTPSYAIFLNGVHPDDRARVEAVLRAALEGGQYYDCQHRVRRPDGSERIIHGRGEVAFDEGGRAARMIGTVQDITELKQAEARLVSLAERNRALMESAYDAILVADPEGRILDANPRAEVITGYSRSRLLGMHASQLHPPDAREQVAESFRNIHAQGHVFEHIDVQRADGTLVPVDISATLVAHGDERYILGVFRDMTERVERERQLLAAKEEADRANQAKSMFLSSMSHELRTPLNAILGFAQLLQLQRDMKPDHIENVDEILKAGRHLLELVNEVLDLAKIEAGRLDLCLERVVCCDLIHESLNLVRSMAEHYGIRLGEDMRIPCPVSFRADRTRLKQVIINLLTNAIKYNRPGGLVTIGLVSGGRAGHVRIEVMDTGLGLTPEQQRELFQPFQRLQAAEKGIEGHGIGLAISKRLVEAMDGRIGVESVPGAGSTFWVELPEMAAVSEIGPAQAQGTEGYGLADMGLEEPAYPPEITVLYVEDNLANIRLVQRLISDRPGWRLIHAQTPELGLERAMFQNVDLILLDINLPGMDGYQVLEQLRAMEKTRAIPVVALTSNATRKDIARGMTAGFTDYLTKPLELDRFWACIDGIVNQPMVRAKALESRAQ